MIQVLFNKQFEKIHACFVDVSLHSTPGQSDTGLLQVLLDTIGDIQKLLHLLLDDKFSTTGRDNELSVDDDNVTVIATNKVTHDIPRAIEFEYKYVISVLSNKYDLLRKIDLPPARPQIRQCRSPNQETFTCWWAPGNDEETGHTNYTLMYTVGQGPPQECPDYMTGGDYSCFFDSQHTSVWELYCMNITAENEFGFRNSDEFCLDVIEIVEPDPPIKLNWSLSAEQQSVLVTWLPPASVDMDLGWITLVYELHYKQLVEPETWKVKGMLSEPHLEIFDLAPSETYVVRVRCKPNKSGQWSKWSENVTIPTVPVKVSDSAFLVGLVAFVGIAVACLFIGFGTVRMGQRIKAWLFPPIPIPRIKGIDPKLLKKGKMDEIDNILTSFSSYAPTLNIEEIWDEVIETGMEASYTFSQKSNLIGSEDTEIVLSKPPMPSAEENSVPLQDSLCSENSDNSDQIAGGHDGMESLLAVEKANILLDGKTAKNIYKAYQTNGEELHIMFSNLEFYTRVTGVSSDGTMQLYPCTQVQGHPLSFPNKSASGQVNNMSKLQLLSSAQTTLNMYNNDCYHTTGPKGSPRCSCLFALNNDIMPGDSKTDACSKSKVQKLCFQENFAPEENPTGTSLSNDYVMSEHIQLMTAFISHTNSHHRTISDSES
ncbi:prolactin receptor-like [Protopterus annectens]|uniref:prolactin receptor-like n=1 Tax=Protopterus annectens TaxID=7888 RepID=UPI001CFACE78|nr:prolactin receptor-like [Protopterus annectens]